LPIPRPPPVTSAILLSSGEFIVRECYRTAFAGNTAGLED
jgi:hypothetical protein